MLFYLNNKRKNHRYYETLPTDQSVKIKFKKMQLLNEHKNKFDIKEAG